MVNGVITTPYTLQRNAREVDYTCVLCGGTRADLEHIMLECEHVRLREIRRTLDTDMGHLIIRKRGVLSGTQHRYAHPIEGVPQDQLYPYTNGIPEGGIGYHLEGLPENRWYRESNTRKGTVTITHPDVNNEHEYRPVRRVPMTTFWALIAWHDITHKASPMRIRKYDQRARDIWEVITRAKQTSGGDTLCYATGRELLDVLMEEGGCDKEYFCNILNTHLGFKHRRSLDAHPSFERAGIKLDGLDQTAYVGSGYGNPPYDGGTLDTEGGTEDQDNANDERAQRGAIGTIEKTLNMASKAADGVGFRAIYFIPMTEHRLSKRLQQHTSSVLMEFPDDTVPFIPDAYWYGESKKRMGGGTGCYKHKHTRLYLLMYESKDIGELREMDYDRLRTRLAEWYLTVIPPKHNNVDTLSRTRIPMKFYEKVQTEEYRMPRSWRFWDKGRRVERTEEGANGDKEKGEYAGGAMDSYDMMGKAVEEMINWDAMAGIAGALPRQVRRFLQHQGCPAAEAGGVAKNMAGRLREYGKQAYK